MATTDEFWPSKDDSVETLQEKRQLNIDAAWGEIACDIALPDRESDVTDYQSNAIVSQEYINEQNNKCTINDIDDEIKEEKVEENNGGCVQPNGIIAPSFSEAFVGFMAVGGVAYYCLKIIELPLLANPTTALIYMTH
uniref:Uncharacterized protein n=1 Tax=Marseillevirus LCMAC201 TaxID=2506605 RepID=A0A481YVF1_9VIRU|nr:MAG: hypothetical protein LCMAC201_01750 [Marseillevirus LCMAC201]